MLIYPFTAQSARPTPYGSQRKPRGITGRDRYVLAEPLYHATEQQKPDDEFAWSDLQDTIAVFNAAVGVENAGPPLSRRDDQFSRRKGTATLLRIGSTARAPKRAYAVFRPAIESLP